MEPAVKIWLRGRRSHTKAKLIAGLSFLTGVREIPQAHKESTSKGSLVIAKVHSDQEYLPRI